MIIFFFSFADRQGEYLLKRTTCSLCNKDLGMRVFLIENGRAVTNRKHTRALPQSPEKLRLARAHYKVKILVYEKFNELISSKTFLLTNRKC